MSFSLMQMLACLFFDMSRVLLPSVDFSKPIYITDIFTVCFGGSSSGLLLILQIDQGLVSSSTVALLAGLKWIFRLNACSDNL